MKPYLTHFHTRQPSTIPWNIKEPGDFRYTFKLTDMGKPDSLVFEIGK